MTTFPQYEAQFVADLLSAGQVSAGPSAQVKALMEALPYFGDADFRAAHRGTLTQVLCASMAQNAISPQPSDLDFWHYTTYSYTGPFHNYADAFFHGAAWNNAATTLVNDARVANPALSSGWWQDYAIAVLTDAARQAAGLSLNVGRLASDLAGLNTTFASGLTASVMAVLQLAYPPTAGVFRELAAPGQAEQACQELLAAIATAEFTTNINLAISAGGDATQAATWFLYLLWTVLKAVGANVDVEIQLRQAAGLSVPPQIGPQHWWQGGYATWYAPLAGPDLAPSAGGMLTAAMPEQSSTVYSGGDRPVYENVTAPSGYSQSLCYWGPLARYKN